MVTPAFAGRRGPGVVYPDYDYDLDYGDGYDGGFRGFFYGGGRGGVGGAGDSGLPKCAYINTDFDGDDVGDGRGLVAASPHDCKRVSESSNEMDW